MKCDLLKGERVKIHPATDLWMRGVRYANVASVGRKWVLVLDDANRTWKIAPDLLERV